MCGWYPEEIKESKMYKIYTQPSCGYCYMAKELLTKNLYQYEEININNEPKAKEYIKSLGFSTVPQIWHKDKHIGGYTELKEYINNV